MHPPKRARIRSDYRRLYPSGKVDRVRLILQYATFAFAVLLLIPLGLFK